MNELNKILNELIKEKGGSINDYKRLLNSIAYHESAHTLDPTIKQQGGGPGRGKYQFEEGNNKGGITAARRTKQYFDTKGIESPKWLEAALKENSLDATKLSSEEQDVLFLGNMRMHPKADFSKIWKGEEDIPTFWSKYHWAGNPRDTNKRLESFNSSLSKYNNEYNNTESFLKDFTKYNQKEREDKNIFTVDFSKGGTLNDYIKQKFNNKNLNSFNTGGLHEQNPYGGIPQGKGNNGKLNTVEQGETSFNLPQGKFIFSNRIDTKGNINQFVDGGIIDPPNKSVVNDSKKFVNDWFNNPITKAKYSMNMGKGFSETLPELEKGLNNINSLNINYNVPNDSKSELASYANNEISFYKQPTEESAVHEFTHAMGIDNNLTKYIRDNFGVPAKAIQNKTGKSFPKAIAQEFKIDDSTSFGRQKVNNVIDHSRYLSNNGELYPRIMEMRKVLNVKPGDIINDNHIKILKESTDNPLFKYYTDDQIKEILNVVASNNKERRNNLT